MAANLRSTFDRIRLLASPICTIFDTDHFGCRLRHSARQIFDCASNALGIVETIDMIRAGSVTVYFEIQRRGKPVPLQAKGAAPSQNVSQGELGFFRGWRWLGLLCLGRWLRRRLSLLCGRPSRFLRFAGDDVEIAADIANFNAL